MSSSSSRSRSSKKKKQSKKQRYPIIVTPGLGLDIDTKLWRFAIKTKNVNFVKCGLKIGPIIEEYSKIETGKKALIKIKKLGKKIFVIIILFNKRLHIRTGWNYF